MMAMETQRRPASPVTMRSAPPMLRRKCACGGTPGPTGECEQCRKKRLGRVQTKLTVNRPGDAYELDADRAAEQVMRMAAPGPMSIGPGLAIAQRRESAPTIGAEVTPDVEQGISALRGGGVPLDTETRAFMEPRYGHDFSKVRIHADARAASLAHSLHALAFTSGRDIVFGANQFATDSAGGRRLLAHELAHVVQQESLTPGNGIFRDTEKKDCATGEACDQPDKKGTGTPTSWNLTIALDYEPEDVGHSWIKLSDNTGTKYSYGFWPQDTPPWNKKLAILPGCVHHPDTKHEPPNATVYGEISYGITQKQFATALAWAQAVCKVHPPYHVTGYNCTTFAIDVAKAAGVSPPSSSILDIHFPTALMVGTVDELRKRNKAKAKGSQQPTSGRK